MSSRKDSRSSGGEDFASRKIRKSSFAPRKHSVVDELNRVIRQRLERGSSSEIELTVAHPWLEKLHNKSPYAVKEGNIPHRVLIPENFYGLCCAKYSPDGSVIATSFGAGAIQIRNSTDGSLLNTLRDPVSDGIPVMSLRFHPGKQDTFYAASACGHIFMCSTKVNQTNVFAYEKNNEVNTIDVSNKGRVLVSGGKDAILRVYDLNKAKLLLTYPSQDSQQSKLGMKENTMCHKSRIFSVRFHPDRQNIFLSGGWDDIVKIWDLRANYSKACVANIRGPHICGEAIDIKANMILTGSWTASNSIQIWDFSTAKAIDTITPHNRPQTIDGEFLYCAQFFQGDSISGHTILTGGSGTGLVEVINISDKKMICYFKYSKTIYTIHNLADKVIFGGNDCYFNIAEYSGQPQEKKRFQQSLHQYQSSHGSGSS